MKISHWVEWTLVRMEMGLSVEGLRGQAVFLILLSLSPILADSRDKGEPLNHLVSLHCVREAVKNVLADFFR